MTYQLSHMRLCVFGTNDIFSAPSQPSQLEFRLEFFAALALKSNQFER